ncbi:MAG: GntR family transcriptional regulator [Verrucomicrobiales bacterium]|nr:GntR family transcriptional regulator [Verrucomicrobiales bacterium]
MTPTPATLARSAEDRLRNEIFAGQWPAGARLAEAAIARRLGVSRVPVREAFASLEREGLVEFTPTGRTVVKKLTARDFEELYGMRLLLEPAGAREAFPLTADQVRALERNIARTRRATKVQDVTRLDLDFHEAILSATRNRRLIKLWSSLRSELQLWLSNLHRQHRDQALDTREQTAESHEEILRCFKTGTAMDCERLAREHILGWREWLPLGETVNGRESGR